MANLFTPAGLDKTAYEERIVFRDPISTYSSLSSASQVKPFTLSPTVLHADATWMRSHLHLSRYTV